MGEAKDRGSKVVRIEKAKEHKATINEAVEKRTHAKGMIWMSIYCAPSIPATDDQGAFMLDDRGEMLYQPDDDKWSVLIPEDVPSWVAAPEVINQLREGEDVCMKASEGGRWYRGVITEEEVAH